MADKEAPTLKAKKAPSREDRLKAALKSNMARRKAQAKARASETTGKEGKQNG